MRRHRKSSDSRPKETADKEKDKENGNGVGKEVKAERPVKRDSVSSKGKSSDRLANEFG